MSRKVANWIIGVILVGTVLAAFIGAFAVTTAAAANTLTGILLALWLIAFIVWVRWA